MILFLICLVPITLLCLLLTILTVFLSFVPLLVEYVAGGVLGVALAIVFECFFFKNEDDFIEDGFIIGKNGKCIKIFRLQARLVLPYFLISAVFITLLVFNILNNIEYVATYSVGTGGGRGQDIDVEWIKKTIPAIILGAVTGYYVIITVVKYFMSFSRMCPKCLSVDSYRVLSKSDHSSRDYTDSKSKDYYGTIGTIYDKDNNKVGTVNGRLGTVEYTRNVHEENWTERSQCSCCGRIKEYRTGYARKSSWK